MEHNKSKSITLSILEKDDDTLLLYAKIIKKQRKQINDGLIPYSKCTLIPAQDGRFTHQRKKVGYAYQIIAFEKFGRDELLKVPTAKSRNDLVISHLCGTLYCCTSEHLILEEKYINDERTHCHFCIRNIFLKAGFDGITTFYEIDGCPHEPICCSCSMD